VTHEQALPWAEGQGVLPERDLFSSLEDQAQDRFVQVSLESARCVLPEED
jgi:hypothetical protein